MILVNGALASEVSARDRGLAYGDGVFRTFAAHAGRPLHWQRQYEKLAHDCAVLSLRVPGAPVLEGEVRVACGARSRCTVKIIVTRGPCVRGYAYGRDGDPTRIVIADEAPGYPEAHAEVGVKARLCALRLAHQPALAGVKHLNRLENVMARAEWDDPDIAEGLLCDSGGRVIGGTMTNVFIVTGGSLATPALDQCGVSGVTRDRVIEAAGRLGITCRIAAIPWREVSEAGEVFLVNSLAGVWPVRELESRPREPGPVTRRVQRALKEEDDAQAL